jgi:Zn-dependent protease
VQVRTFHGNLIVRWLVQIASPFGIPLRLHWSFFALIAGFLGWGFYMAGLPGVFGVGVASLGLFVSVALHELGHAIAARRYGINTAHITLYPFGGVAAIERMPEDPDQEMVIALAGPAVNFALAALGGWIWLGADKLELILAPIALGFVITNLGMGLFNLIPAFPMDGGRVLRSLLARRMGFLPASRLSVRIGRLFAWGFIATGAVWPWLWGSTYPHFSLVLVGGFLLVALRSEEARLVDLYWQQVTGREPWWTKGDGDNAGPKSFVPARW